MGNHSMFHALRILSLRIKVIIFTLGLFLVSIGIITFQFSVHLRQELEVKLSNQQLSEVSFVAERIDSSVKLRVDSLTLIASSITPQLMKHPDQVSAFRLSAGMTTNMCYNGINMRTSPANPTSQVFALILHFQTGYVDFFWCCCQLQGR